MTALRPRQLLTLLEAWAQDHGLESYMSTYEVDTETLEGQIELNLVLPDDEIPYNYRASVCVHYFPRLAHATNRHMDGFDLEEGELVTLVEVLYYVLPEGIALADLEDAVRPKVDLVNSLLGGDPRPVHYTVSANYATGEATAMEVRVLASYELSLLVEDLDLGFMEDVARILPAICGEGPGPRPGARF